MDALPNDEALRMDEFSVQPMPVATPMPWENYGIMMNPFQNPMQMMRQVYPLPAQHLDLVQQHVTPQEQLVDQQQQEQQLQLLPHEPQLQLLSQEPQLLIPHPQQVQLLPQPQQVQLTPQPQLIERKPTSDGVPKLAVPQGPDAIRTKLREALTDALKMVAAEQAKEDLLAFLDSSKAEAVVSIRTSTDPESYDFLDHHDFQFPPPVIVRKPRSKLQAHGGKGSPNKRMRVDNSSGDGVEAWEQKVANHAKLLSRNIELELLRMFKDVNKKYKEKARSLKFNLADKNNPELRGRVFFGEISPPVLCNMTIEQLASKELSEWRMAKAEERAHMVVITDEDVNTSKLVKKTHKGEFIMEVDNDTATDVLAPVASSVKDESEGSEETEQVDEGVGVEEQTDPQEESMLEEEQAEQAEQSERTELSELTGGEEGSTAPNEAPVADGGDPAKSVGSNIFEENSDVLDVSDFKGLPEIMSMDGYLKSVGCAQREDGTPFESEIMNGESKPSDLPSAERENTPEQVKSTLVQGDNPLKRKQPEEPSEIRERSKSSSPRPSNDSPRAEKDSPRPPPPTDGSSPRARAEKVGEESARSVEVWDGSLQLTGTRSTAVRAVFRSGQDVKLDAWPKSLGVKGRVKVGHLAKFLKELCSSKSRTVTALSFYSSDMATSSLSLLKEVVDGYVKGERVGYVEPSTGFELYLLPPGEASWKLLTENGRLKPGDVSGIPSDRSEVLVGCVVWRKSPSSVSQSERSKKSHHHHHHSSSGGSSSSKNKTGSTSASRSKQTPTVSASQAPPVSTLPFATSTATAIPATVTPAAPSSTLSLQQSSQSVVVKHPVNEWHQSSLCPMPPVGVDSVVAAPVPGLRAAPPFTLGGMFFPPGFPAPANSNNASVNNTNGLQQQLLPGGILSGLEGGGPPGFRQHCRPTSLDDLPDYDELVASSAPPLSYGLSTSFSSGVGNQYNNHNSGSVNSLTDAFQARGFQASTVASSAAAPESFVIPRGSRDVHHHHGFGHRPEWSSTGVVAQVAPQVTSAQHAQHVQHHMFMQQQPSSQHPQAQRGPPPLPPGPPPPPFGQWRHPNQSSLHYKKGHHSNGQRRYRS